MLSTYDHGDFKNLPRRLVADKVLLDKAFNIVKNPKHDGYQHEPASMVYKLFEKQKLHLKLLKMEFRKTRT